jgi:hypothetical protein
VTWVLSTEHESEGSVRYAIIQGQVQKADNHVPVQETTFRFTKDTALVRTSDQPQTHFTRKRRSLLNR